MNAVKSNFTNAGKVGKGKVRDFHKITEL